MLVANKISAKDAAGYIVFSGYRRGYPIGYSFLISSKFGFDNYFDGANGYTDLTQALLQRLYLLYFLLVFLESTSKGQLITSRD